MFRNRKVQSIGVRFGPAVRAFVLCLLIGGAGVGYVNQKNRIHLLSEQMRKLEIQCDKQRLYHQALIRRLTALNSSVELEAQVKKMNLDLSPTPPDRIVHLPVMSAGSLKKDERLYVNR